MALSRESLIGNLLIILIFLTNPTILGAFPEAPAILGILFEYDAMQH